MRLLGLLLWSARRRLTNGRTLAADYSFLTDTNLRMDAQQGETLHFKTPLTMDTSAREAMKDAAKCDKHCELQISANQ